MQGEISEQEVWGGGELVSHRSSRYGGTTFCGETELTRFAKRSIG